MTKSRKNSTAKGSRVVNSKGQCGVVIKSSGGLTDVLFDDGFRNTFAAEAVRIGTFRNPNYPSHHGVGFIGDGIRGTRTDEKAYRFWRSMMKWCYCERDKKANLSVVSEWHNFQNFANFVESQVGSDAYSEDAYQISKHRLENKYSPYTVVCRRK